MSNSKPGGAGINIREERMKFTRNKLVAGLIIALGVTTSIVFGTQSHAAIWSGQDCSTNAIVKCGVSSPSDLRAKYKASSELQALYGHFGVTSSVINGTMYSGTVTNSGDVIVNGKVVATNAMSVGRHQDDGSGCKGTPFTVAGHTYYEGTTACRFGTNPNYTGQAAYVMLTADGQFAGAILKPCGNIVPAKPVPPKPKPQTVACSSLSATSISSTMVGASKLNFTFTAKASTTNGAKVNSYTYNFGDGKSTTTGATTSHAYTQTGTYTATVTVNATVNGKATSVTSAACKVTVKPYKATPKPPVVSCTSLKLITVKDGTYNLSASASASQGVANVQEAGVISGYTYTVKDSKGAVVKTVNQTTNATASQSGNITLTPGNYVAQVVVHSNAGDKTGTQCTVKICVPQPPKTIQVCRLSDYTVVTINESAFDSQKYSKNLDDCKPVQVCDTTTNTLVMVHKNQIDNKRYTTDLTKCQKVQVCDTTTYTIVSVYPNQIDNQRYTKDLSLCQNVKVCDTTTGSIVEVKKGQVDNNRYTTDLTKCNVQVCDTTTNTVLTVTKDQAKDSKYTTDLSQCSNVEVCDTTTHQIVTVTKHEAENNDKYTTDTSKCEKVEVCDTTTGTKVEVYPSQIDNTRYTTDMTKCTPVVTPPQTPPELPHTGASDVIMSLVGAGSLIAAFSYYVASRRAL